MDLKVETIQELTKFDILTKYLIKYIEEDKYIDKDDLKSLLIILGKMEGNDDLSIK
jgi:hypothetical protein